MIIAPAGNGKGNQGAVQPGDGPQVTQGQNVIGLLPGVAAQAALQRPALSGCKRKPMLQPLPQGGCKGGRWAFQQSGGWQQGVHRILRAKTKVGDKAKPG